MKILVNGEPRDSAAATLDALWRDETADLDLSGPQGFAIALNGAVVGRECIVATGALLTEGKVFPDRSLISGRPAKVTGQVDDAEAARLVQRARELAAR